jgi:hypothetical protein
VTARKFSTTSQFQISTWLFLYASSTTGLPSLDQTRDVSDVHPLVSDACGHSWEISVFSLLKRGDKAYPKIIPDASSANLMSIIERNRSR